MKLRRVRRPRAVLAATLVAALLAAGCGSPEESAEEASPGAGARVEDPGPVHVHGLGVNPDDGALFIATHTGLFRAAPGDKQAARVGDRFQDTMGFSVVGPNRFLGSGHPDGRDDLPPFLGLMESRDAGRTWKPVSLLGERDFHVLEARGKRVYGFGSDFETRTASLLVSDDGGRTWDERDTPEDLISLAIDPGDPARVVVSGPERLYASANDGRRWRPLEGPPGLLTWPARNALYVVGADGRVLRSDDAGRSWQAVGEVGSEPAAFESESASDLYVAIHDGTIKRSTDGGASWSIRSRP